MGIRPAVVIQVGAQSDNALAWAGQVVESTWGTVFLGIRLLERELHEDNHRGWGGLVVAGIIAHEFAHIYQYQNGLTKRLRTEGASAVLSELHADFLAGWYLGIKRKEGASMDIGAFADGIYFLGDRNVSSPQHHGTEIQRRRAVVEGFKRGVQGNAAISEVSEEGIEVVRDVLQIRS